MLNVAVIGAGRIGRVHAHAIAAHPEATLTLISDPFGSAAEDVAKIHGARSSRDAADVFTDPEVDAVVIGSPTALHAEQVLAAARAGKAVLCEKPIAIDVAEARRLLEELEGFEHPPVMVGFNRRFDPSMRRAFDLMQEGRIGPVSQVTVITRDPEPPPASYIQGSGGIFRDMTIHDFDLVRFYLGEIAEVTAVGQNILPEIRDAGDFDGTAIVLKATSGAVATITNNRGCASGYDQRVEIQGRDGLLSVDNVRPTALRISTGEYSDAQDPYLDFFLTRYAEAYSNELTAFIEAATKGAAVSPDVSDGVAALALAEAAEVSAREKRTVVL